MFIKIFNQYFNYDITLQILFIFIINLLRSSP